MTRAPWLAEPSAAYFSSPRIALYRNTLGAWCGYVAVAESHPWYGKGYDYEQAMPEGWLEKHEATADQIGIMSVFSAACAKDIEKAAPLNCLIRCHGGLTYAGKALWLNPGWGSWWFGFDCSHSGDVCPKWGKREWEPNAVYRDYEYVREAALLAASDIAKFGALQQ